MTVDAGVVVVVDVVVAVVSAVVTAADIKAGGGDAAARNVKNVSAHFRFLS